MNKLFGSLVPEMNTRRKLVTRISEEEAAIPYYNIPIYCKEVIEPKYETINKIGRVKLTEGLEIDVYGSFEEPWFMGTDIIRLLDLKDVGKTIDNIPSSMKDKFLTPASTGGSN